MRVRIRKRALAVGANCTLLIIAACGGGDGASTTGGGTVIVGMRTDLAGINPVTYTDQYTGEVINYALFTPLIQYDENLQVRPHLAESWELTGDSGVVFKLRSDVKWHDGQPVTAEDVKFTFDLAKDPATASLIGSAFLPDVDRARGRGQHAHPFSFCAAACAGTRGFLVGARARSICCRTWRQPKCKTRRTTASLSAAVRSSSRSGSPTSGSYSSRNPDYPAALGGPAVADRRGAAHHSGSRRRMLTELMTGGVHVDIPVSPDQLDQIKSDQSQQLFAFPGRTVYYIGWNNQRAPFTSTAVRRALAMAINRQEIIDALLSGEGAHREQHGAAMTSAVSERRRPRLLIDHQQAGQLLEQEGWRDGNGDGIREKGGQPLRFTLLSSDNSAEPLGRRSGAGAAAESRRGCADPRALEFQTLLAQHMARDFDAVFTSWVLDNFQMASAPMALLPLQSADGAGFDQSQFSRDIPRSTVLIDQAAGATDRSPGARGLATDHRNTEREQPFTFVYWLNELAACAIDRCRA